MKYNRVSVQCGDSSKPVMILFHGFPSSSHMFRDLMPMLQDSFHLIAPDYPGFGQSDFVNSGHFALESCCDEIALLIRKFIACG